MPSSKTRLTGIPLPYQLFYGLRFALFAFSTHRRPTNAIAHAPRASRRVATIAMLEVLLFVRFSA